MNSQQAAGRGGAATRDRRGGPCAAGAVRRRPVRRSRSPRASRRSPEVASARPTSSTRTARHLHRPGRPLLEHRRATDTNGCDCGSLPIGTPVEVDGASRPGTLVYNSWISMQANGETNADACAYNDFALVRIDPADVGQRQPVGPPLRRADRPRQSAGGPRRHRLQLRQLLASRRRHHAEPEAGRRRPGRGQRLEPDRLHGHAGVPGDSGSGFMDANGAGDRRPQHAGDRAGGRPPTGSGTCAASSTGCTPTPRSRASTSLTAPSRSSRISSARSSVASSALGLSGSSVDVPSSIEGASTVSSLKTNTKIATIAIPRAMPRTIPMMRSPRLIRTRGV